jgi:hypothetical protein
LPSDEWRKETHFLDPKCVSISAIAYNDTDDTEAADNEDYGCDDYRCDDCDNEDCYHDMEEEEDMDHECEEKWELNDENYVSTRTRIRIYREVGNNSGIRGFGTSKSTVQY